MASKYVKAYLLVEGGWRIQCWFNPTTLTVSRKAVWRTTSQAGKPVPDAVYVGGQPDALSLKLLLHAGYLMDQHAANGKTGTDVRTTVNQLMSLLNPKQQGGQRLNRPPLVQFIWGSYVSFVAICKSVNVTTELFDIDGSPLRAQVDLSLAQYESEPGQGGMDKPQNPTSRATRRHSAHPVKVGDSLPSIAWEHYKDPTRWREIAEYNRIDDPSRLRPGAVLAVPLERQ